MGASMGPGRSPGGPQAAEVGAGPPAPQQNEIRTRSICNVFQAKQRGGRMFGKRQARGWGRAQVRAQNLRRKARAAVQREGARKRAQEARDVLTNRKGASSASNSISSVCSSSNSTSDALRYQEVYENRNQKEKSHA